MSEVFLGYEPWSKQELVHMSDARTRVVIAGRQSGKSLTAVAEACQWALEKPRAVVWWVTANYQVKDKAWRDLTEHLRVLPQGEVRGTESRNRIDLGNGSMIVIKSADGKDSLVAETLDSLVCDEFAQWKETAWFQLRPMLDVKNAPVIFVGTPKGRNWAYRLWLRGHKILPVGHPQAGFANPDHDPTYESFHWRTAESPYSSIIGIEQARRDMHPDWFRQEYEADIIENAAAVFRNVANCIKRLPAQPDQWTVLGIDLGRKLDRSAIVVMNGRREVIDMETMPVDWPQQKQRIAAQAFKYNARRLVVDSTGVGDPIARDLAQAGFPVEEYVITGGGASKHVLMDGLRIAISQANLSFPDNSELLRELDAYQYEVGDTGRITYSAPEGEHDDLVVALALALHGQRGLVYLPQRSGGPENYMKRSKRPEAYLGAPKDGPLGVAR